MARRRPPARARVERKIYFYRIEVPGGNGGGRATFDLAPVLEYIDGLPFTSDGRYLEAAERNATCCWVDRGRPPHRLRMANVRRSGLPQVERGGRLSRLNIPAESGLVEQVHVVCFPDGIIGSEFNFYGPRLSRLGRYLTVKAGALCPEIRFEPLLREDVVQQLMRLGDIRLLQLRIRAGYAAVVAQADRDLGAAFQAARRAGEADEVEVILKPRAYSRGRLSERILTAVRTLARRTDVRESVERFVVKGLDRETQQVEMIDVLSDYLISRKQIILEDPRTRALNSGSAYAAVEEAYEELRDELRAAARAEG